MKNKEIRISNGLLIAVSLAIGLTFYFWYTNRKAEAPTDPVVLAKGDYQADTTKYKPKETPEVIGYGVITDWVDGGPWTGPVNLFSSVYDSRVIIGEVMPKDTVAIYEKGDTYWYVADKHDPENSGYLMAGWVNEINTQRDKKKK